MPNTNNPTFRPNRSAKLCQTCSTVILYFRALKGKGFMMEERGKIELRGYGTLGTFFLTGNENASVEELTGRSKQDVTYVNENEKKSAGMSCYLVKEVLCVHTDTLIVPFYLSKN